MVKKKNPGGRPTKVTPEVTAKLEECLKYDYTITESCRVVGIDTDTYHRHMANDPSFAAKMTSAQTFALYKARRNIVEAILEGDMDSSWKYARLRQKERYTEQNAPQDINLVNVNEVVNNGNIEAIADALRQLSGASARLV